MKSSRIIFQFVLTILLFTFWAAFALLVINPFYQNNLPGYVIGTICIWEFIAIAMAALIAHFMINKWGSIQIIKVDNKSKILMNAKFAFFFLIYIFVAVVIAIWQFWVFSQKF
jgi:hypothetical protein